MWVALIRREAARFPHPSRRQRAIVFLHGERLSQRQPTVTCSQLCARWHLHRRTAVSHTPIFSQGKTVSFSALCVASFRFFHHCIRSPFCQGRSGPIVTPQPQLPPAYTPSAGRGFPEPRDADNRSYSRHANHSRSQSQASQYSTSQPPAPPLFNPEDRGYPYASVPQPAFPIPLPSRSVTPATRPSNAMPSFPQISAPPPINPSSRPSSNTSQPYFPSSSTLQSQNYNYR